MADIVRDVLIKVAVERKELNADRAADSTGNLDRKVKELDRDLKELDRSLEATQSTTEEYAEANEKLFNKIGALTSSSLQLARGFAFLAAASEDDLKKSLQIISGFQGAIDVFRGATGAIKSLATQFPALAGLLNPWTLAVVGAVVAVLAIVKAINAWSEAQAGLNKEMQDALITMGESNAAAAASEQNMLSRRLNLMDNTEQLLQIEKSLAAERKANAILEKDQDRLRQQPLETPGRAGSFVSNAIFLAQIADNQLALEERKLQVMQEQQREQDKMLQSASRQLETLEKQLEVENKKQESISQQVGLLSKGQQAGLDALLKKVESGEQLSAREIKNLNESGVDAAKELGQKQAQGLAKGTDIDERLARAIGSEDRESVILAEMKKVLTDAGIKDGKDIAGFMNDLLTATKDANDAQKEVIDKLIIEAHRARSESQKLKEALGK